MAPGQDGLSHIKIPCITDLPRRKEWGCLKKRLGSPNVIRERPGALARQRPYRGYRSSRLLPEA